MTSEEEIIKSAADWVMKIEDNPDLMTDDAFERWLHADPRHVRAYNTVANMWQASAFVDAAAAAAARPSRAETLLLAGAPAALRGMWTAARRPAFAAAGAAVLAGLAVAVATLLDMGAGAPPVDKAAYATAAGIIDDIQLPDNSRLILDSKSGVEIAFGAAAREVVLLRGRVFVDVEPDPARPLSVALKDVRFVATGTAFSVYDTDAYPVLEVYEGRVRVERAGLEAVSVSARQGLRVTARGVEAFAPAPPGMEGVPDWTRAHVVFDGVALDDAVREFQRYTDKRIVVADPALARHKVSGAFSLTDVEAFVRSVEVVAGAEAAISTETIVIRAGGKG